MRILIHKSPPYGCPKKKLLLKKSQVVGSEESYFLRKKCCLGDFRNIMKIPRSPQKLLAAPAGLGRFDHGRRRRGPETLGTLGFPSRPAASCCRFEEGIFSGGSHGGVCHGSMRRSIRGRFFLVGGVSHLSTSCNCKTFFLVGTSQEVGSFEFISFGGNFLWGYGLGFRSFCFWRWWGASVVLFSFSHKDILRCIFLVPPFLSFYVFFKMFI